MKIFSLLLLAFVIPSTSHALVKELALCTTANGRYQISIQDNQGTGPIRSSHIIAAIAERAGRGLVLASYPAELYMGFHSISFGRPHYQDVGTRGRRFLLSGPSTNFRHYSVRAWVQGRLLADDNLRCSVFMGHQ